MTLAEFIETWHDFYMLAGTVAATLLGLLFIGISINLEMIRRVENIGFDALAHQTFANFLYVLFLAFTFLVPHQNLIGVVAPLLGIGSFGLYNNVRALTTALHNRPAAWNKVYFFRRFALPLAAFIGLIAIGIVVWQGAIEILYWLIFVILVLLVSATRNAWDLLVRVGRPS